MHETYPHCEGFLRRITVIKNAFKSTGLKFKYDEINWCCMYLPGTIHQVDKTQWFIQSNSLAQI